MTEQLQLVDSACAPFKRCRCCRRAYSYADWQSLHLVGVQYTEDENGHYLTEHRDCAGPGCGGTMALEWRLG